MSGRARLMSYGHRLRERLQANYWKAGSLPDEKIDTLMDAEFPARIAKNDPEFVESWLNNGMVEPRRVWMIQINTPLYIEPKHGYSIVGRNKIYFRALPESERAIDPENRVWFGGLPSVTTYAIPARRPKPSLHLPRAIMLRHIYDGNYFHALNEVMSQLYWFAQKKIPDEVPLIVSHDLAVNPFFKTWSSRGSLARRKWIVQETDHILCDSLIVCKSDFLIPEQIDYFLQSIEAPTHPDAEDRVFLTRRGRSLVNLDRIEAIAAGQGFRTVDTGTMTPLEQMERFSRTKYLVGLHGAGMANILFRRAGRGKMNILEILPSNWPKMYYMGFSNLCGFRYASLIGGAQIQDEADPNFSNYALDEGGFERALNELLSQ